MPANLILFSVLSVVGYALFDRRWRHLWQQLGFTRPESVNVGLAAATGIVLSVAGIAPLLWLGELPDNEMSFAHEDFIGLSFGPSTMAAAFVWALLHQGLPEELFFRGLLLGQLARKLSVTTAIVVQGGIFWAIHVPAYVYLWQATQQAVPRLIVVMVAVMTLGVSFMLGWLRMRDANRSLVPPIIAHTLANGITYTTAMLLA